jgi:hypothetical protein
MRYAIAIFTCDNDLHACHEVAGSKVEAILNALKSLDLYYGPPIVSLEDYLDEIDVEVEVLAIHEDDEDTDGCVIALYDANNKLAVEYYPNQTTYETILRMLGNIIPLDRVKNLNDLIEFLEDLEMLVDTQEVTCHD